MIKSQTKDTTLPFLAAATPSEIPSKPVTYLAVAARFVALETGRGEDKSCYRLFFLNEKFLPETSFETKDGEKLPLSEAAILVKQLKDHVIAAGEHRNFKRILEILNRGLSDNTPMQSTHQEHKIAAQIADPFKERTFS